MPQLIAETAWHHEGDFSFMSSLIDAICTDSHADIVKIHLTLDLDEYMSTEHDLFPILNDMQLTTPQWQTIINTIQGHQKPILALVNDTKALDLALEHDIKLLEFHNILLSDCHFLSHAKSQLTDQHEIVLGVGGSTLDEIEFVVNFLDHSNITLMFGFQSFPTDYRDINFKKMRKIKALFPQFKFGYADHTSWDEPNNGLISLLGAAIGVDYLEKHVTTHHGENRIDWQSAISIDMCQELAEKLSILSTCEGNGRLQLNAAEQAYSQFGPMKKTAILARDVKQGDAFNWQYYEFKRTNHVSNISIHMPLSKPNLYYQKDLSAGSIISQDDFTEQKP